MEGTYVVVIALFSWFIGGMCGGIYMRWRMHQEVAYWREKVNFYKGLVGR